MPVYARTKTVFDRDAIGRFAAECDRAAAKTVKELVETGARSSRAMAPGSGYNVASYSQRAGYVPLKRSIRTRTPGKIGWWYSIAPHAPYVENDTAPHLIYGKLSFTWAGGRFYWADKKFGPISSQAKGPYRVISSRGYKNWDAGGAWVLHPGTSAQPFLRPPYDRYVRPNAMRVAAKHYPG